MVSRFVLIALMLGLLAACSSSPVATPGRSAKTPPTQPVEQSPGAGRLPAPENSASAGLLERARQSRLVGNYEQASGLLQRAQRIDPRNGLVYLELSRLYQDQGDNEGARSAAERGLLYCDEATCRHLRQLL